MKLFTVIEGNTQKLDGGAMFGNAPKAIWEKWITPDSSNRILLHCRALFFNYENKNCLFETGIGAFFEPKLADRYGVIEKEHMLLKNLKEKTGLSHEDIDYIFLSHLHFDHAGGLLSAYDKNNPDSTELLFPNAKFITSKGAWLRANNPHPRDRASFIPKLNKLLKDTGRLILIEEGSILTEPFFNAFEFYFTHGHTPDQMHTLVKINKFKVFFAGDLIPGTEWVHLPITMGYDRFPEKLIDEKKFILEKAFSNDWILFFTHDRSQPFCKINKDSKDRFIAEPMSRFA